jgi:DNA-binding IclR family transcriptional regulator
LSVSGPQGRMDEAAVERIGLLLKDAGTRLAALLSER